MVQARERVQPFDEKEIKHGLTEVSTFEVMFPKYREAYLKEAEKYIKKALDAQKLAVFFDYANSTATVSTTNRTKDPYAVINGRDVMKLVARGVPLEKAARLFEDGVSCDIIQINDLVKNKTTFIKRKERLLGPNGNTVKSLELLTDCHIQPQGNTVAAIGDYKRLRDVRRVVLKCMENVHPIYELKRLMVIRELEKDPNLKNESWDRYLPQYKKTHSGKAKKGARKENRASTGELPQQEPRKIDREMETGKYFTKASKKERKEGKTDKGMDRVDKKDGVDKVDKKE